MVLSPPEQAASGGFKLVYKWPSMDHSEWNSHLPPTGFKHTNSCSRRNRRKKTSFLISRRHVGRGRNTRQVQLWRWGWDGGVNKKRRGESSLAADMNRRKYVIKPQCRAGNLSKGSWHQKGLPAFHKWFSLLYFGCDAQEMFHASSPLSVRQRRHSNTFKSHIRKPGIVVNISSLWSR